MRSHRLSEWTSFLRAAGFTVRSAREWELFLDIPSWTQRMRTPPAAVATIEQLLRDASPAVRARLHIEERGGAPGFVLPVALIMAIKTA